MLVKRLENLAVFVYLQNRLRSYIQNTSILLDLFFDLYYT